MTQKELDIIKNAAFSDGSKPSEIYREMQKIIGDRTDNFTNPQGISSEKIDMTETIKQHGYSVDLYKKTFGSTMRSEEDACKNLITKIKVKTDTTKGDSDKEKRRRKLKIKLKLQLQLAEN